MTNRPLVGLVLTGATILKDVMPLAIQEQIEKLKAALPPESDGLADHADLGVPAQTTPHTGTP